MDPALISPRGDLDSSVVSDPSSPVVDIEGLENLQAAAACVSPNNATQELSAKELKRNRAVATVLHFVLTYPSWSISLFIFLASMTTPLPTVNEQVKLPFANLRKVVNLEAAAYHQCVQTGFEWQDSKVDRVSEAEQERANQQRALFHAQMEEAADAVETCRLSVTAAQQSLQGWDALGLDVPRTYNATVASYCTWENQDQLAIILNEDLAAVQNTVGSILDAYITNSLSTLRRVMQYSGDRGSYDYNYFVGVKIEGVVGVLDQLTVPNILLELPELDLAMELKLILQDLWDALLGAYSRIDVLTVRIADFEASIQAFSLNYKELYLRFQKIGNFMGDFAPRGLDIPDFFDISGIPLVETLMPLEFSIPNYGVGLPNIDDLVSEYIVKAVALIARLLRLAAVEATEKTRELVEALIALLKDLLVLEDYDPPQYPSAHGAETPEEEIARMEALADKTKMNAGVALDDLEELHGEVPGYVPADPDLGDVEPLTLPEHDQTRFSFLDLGVLEIVVPVWILSLIGFIVSRTFLIECLTQAIRLYRLKRKYEKNAKPDLPEIDYQDEKDDEKEETKPSKAQMAKVMILSYLTNAWVIIGLMFIPFALCVLMFWFPHVKRTCIDSRQGTFLARSVLKQVQVNRANAQGHALHSLAQQQCHRRQREICSRKATESDAAFRNDAAALSAMQSRFNQSIDTWTVLDRCVDSATLDEQFELHCCGLEGYTRGGIECSTDQLRERCPIDIKEHPSRSYRPVGESLLEPTCDFDMGSLKIQGTLFDCSVLEETCMDAPCNGVDADLIEEMTIDADCSAEIYAIQVCMFLVLAVFHAIMINIFNGLLFNGLLHLYWKSLNPDGIQMKTQVKSDGGLVYGNDRQERLDKIEKAMKRFELAGWVQIGLSAAVFSFWLFAFLILKRVMEWDVYH